MDTFNDHVECDFMSWLYNSVLLNSTDNFIADLFFSDPQYLCVLLQCPVWEQKWQSQNVSHGRKYISHNVCAKCPMSVGKSKLSLVIRFSLYSRPIKFFTFSEKTLLTWGRDVLRLLYTSISVLLIDLPALSELSVGFSSAGIWLDEGIILLDLWNRWKKIKLYF